MLRAVLSCHAKHMHLQHHIHLPPGAPGLICRVLKLLSEDPSNYPDAPREGIRRVLEEVTGIPHPR